MGIEWIGLAVGIVFLVLGLVCIFLIFIGLPGTWMLIGLALIVEFTDQFYRTEPEYTTFSWWILGISLALAALGEFLEFVAGLLGAKKAGSSKYGMFGAFFGGILGAVMGMAIPLPIIGPLLGAVIGTFVGAVVGELTHPDQPELADTIKPATGATIGKILGTLSKIPIAIAVWIMLVISVFI